MADIDAEIAALEAKKGYLEKAQGYRDAKEKHATKPTPKTFEAYVEAKAALMEARREWRENHRSAPRGPGDATVAPDAVGVAGKSGKVG